MIATLLQILWFFGLMSLVAVGGGITVIPEMQRASVEVYHWVTNREFVDMFAITRAAPGPGTFVAVLIGMKAAGLAGAVTAFTATYGPSTAIILAASGAWRRYKDAPWRDVVERALAPVAVGLTFASGIALVESTDHAWLAYAITAVTTVVLATTDITPIILLAIGGAIAYFAGL